MTHKHGYKIGHDRFTNWLVASTLLFHNWMNNALSIIETIRTNCRGISTKIQIKHPLSEHCTFPSNWIVALICPNIKLRCVVPNYIVEFNYIPSLFNHMFCAYVILLCGFLLYWPHSVWGFAKSPVSSDPTYEIPPKTIKSAQIRNIFPMIIGECRRWRGLSHWIHRGL